MKSEGSCALGISVVILSRYEMVSHGAFQLRCIQPLEYLSASGFNVRLARLEEFVPGGEDLIILHRVIGTSYVLYLTKYAQSLGSVVLYDTDDLIFNDVGVNYLLRIGRKGYAKDLAAVQKLMKICNAISVSTSSLKNACQGIHDAVFINRNALSYSYYETALLHKLAKSTDKPVVIAYLSGSDTHREDFKVVEPSILRVLSDFPQAKFLSVGYLTVSSAFDNFPGRVMHKEFLPYDEFQKIFQQIDINLIPLEIGEDFCQSKSELKFIEAGAYGVPSVASATSTYKEAITHGENGYLVSNEREWYTAIVALLDNEHRFQLGKNARKTTFELYSPHVRAEGWRHFLCEFLTQSEKHKSEKESFLTFKFKFYKALNDLRFFRKKMRRKLKSRVRRTKKPA